MAALIILGALAGILSFIAFRRSPELPALALRAAWRRFVEFAPRMAVAMVLAGFVGRLIPEEAAGRWIGPETGFLGVLIASGIGGFVPSGPILAFPIVVVLLQSGAGLPQVVAFITAWSLLGWHRLVIYEAPMMGWSFGLKRLVSSLALPPVSGALTMGLMRIYYG